MNQFDLPYLSFFYHQAMSYAHLLKEPLIISAIFMMIMLGGIVAFTLIKLVQKYTTPKHTTSKVPEIRVPVIPDVNPYKDMSINQLIKKRDGKAKVIGNMAKVLMQREHPDMKLELDDEDELYDDVSDEDLQYEHDFWQMHFKLIDEVLTQKQYDIYYYLNCDPNIPDEKKLYDQIEFIENLPPNERGQTGVKFRLKGKIYSVRKIDYYFQSDTIREEEGSLIIL